MRVSELKTAMQFALDSVKGRDTIPAFDALIAVIRQNAQTRPNQEQQPITDQKKAVLAAIEGVSLSGLTINERDILAIFINPMRFGPHGVSYINEIFAEHNLDPMGAVNAMEAIKKEFTNLVGAAERTLGVLQPLKIEEMDKDIEKGRAAIQIIFKKKVAVDNITNLKDQTEEWWYVVRGVSLLTNTAVEENRILTVQKGSPLIVELSSVYIAVRVVGLIVDKVLTAVDRYLDLKKKVEEVRHMNLQNKQIERDLDKEAENFRETIVEDIKTKIIEEIAPDKKSNGEIHKAMEITVKNVFAFLDKGGSIDCRVPEDNSSSDAKQLQQMYERIRLLESKLDGVRLLEEPKQNV
jgi:hypothetical protein